MYQIFKKYIIYKFEPFVIIWYNSTIPLSASYRLPVTDTDTESC